MAHSSSLLLAFHLSPHSVRVLLLALVTLVTSLPIAYALECKVGVEPLDLNNSSASSCALCTWREECALAETRCLAYSVHDGARLVRVYQCDTVEGCRQVRALQHSNYMCCPTDMCTGAPPESRAGGDDERAHAESEEAGSGRSVLVLVLVLALVLAAIVCLIVLAYRCADDDDDTHSRHGRRRDRETHRRGALV